MAIDAGKLNLVKLLYLIKYNYYGKYRRYY
jgi:hypothetical protein